MKRFKGLLVALLAALALFGGLAMPVGANRESWEGITIEWSLREGGGIAVGETRASTNLNLVSLTLSRFAAGNNPPLATSRHTCNRHAAGRIEINPRERVQGIHTAGPRNGRNFNRVTIVSR